MQTSIPVSVKICSQMTDLTSEANYPDDTSTFIGGDEESGEPDVVFDLDRDDPDPGDPEENENREDAIDPEGLIRFLGDGTLTDCGDRLELTYSEDSLIGMEGCTVTLVFDRGGHRVTMYRSGAASAAMVFSDTEPRQYCTYDTGVPGFPLELCVVTRTLHSSVSARGGTLALDYIIEIRGVPAERTFFRLELAPLPDVPEPPAEY